MNTFRCYAYQAGDGQYVARCLDLLLMGEGPTMEAAIAELNEIILGYLESAHANDLERQLVPRPYSWRVWLHFYWLLTANTIKAWLGGTVIGFLFFTQRVDNGRLVYA